MKYPKIIKISRGSGYPAARTPMDLPVSQQVIRTLNNALDVKPVVLPQLGGSLPLYIFTDILQMPTILVSIVNYDNNQHQPNENLRIGHLWKGIETFAALLIMEK